MWLLIAFALLAVAWVAAMARAAGRPMPLPGDPDKQRALRQQIETEAQRDQSNTRPPEAKPMNNGTLDKIQKTIYQVRNLVYRPMEAIEHIQALLDEANIKREIKALELPSDPVPMSTRSWLALCGCIAGICLLLGWSARTHTAEDRYMRAMAGHYRASETYYNSKLTNMIDENKQIYKGAKTP